METIKEVFSDIRESIGDKGFFIFIGVAVIFGLYNLVKGSNQSSDRLTPVTSIASYPDAVTNANVIIDTLQDSIEYSENRITGQISSTHEQLSEEINANFQATNDYINNGFASQEKLLEENFDELHGSLDKNFTEIKESQNAITGHIHTMKQEISNNTSSISGLSGTVSSLSGTVSGLDNTVSGLSGTVSGLGNTVSGLGSTVSGLGSTVSGLANKISNIGNSSGGSGDSAPPPDNTIQYTTKSGLNTSTSIVDALKASGVDSSFEHRAELYYANGGKGTYTGSYSQNVSMLNSLKAGKLKG